MLEAAPSPAEASDHDREPGTTAAEIEADGPYLLARGDGWRVLTRNAGGDAEEYMLADGEPLAVPAAAGLPGFDVELAPLSSGGASADLPLAADVPLVVLGDTHGEYEIVVPFLIAHGVIDEALCWRFGTGRLVILGDIFDRGPHQLSLLWLFYKLSVEAAQAGGAVHIILGNHDVMILRGDLRYMHPRHADTAAALGFASFPELFGANSFLGRWLRSWPTLLRLGDLLFVHGGIGPQLVGCGLDLAAINAQVRIALEHPAPPADHPGILHATHPEGPLWYRGYFRRGKGGATKAEVKAALKHFHASRIFVGHTVVERVHSLFGGRVVAVHVYPRLCKTTGGPICEAAMRRAGRWYRLDAQGRRTALRLRS